MRNRIASLIVVLVVALAVASILRAQSASGSTPAKKVGRASARPPDLSGNWEPTATGPESLRRNTWDPDDPYGQHPEQAPMLPWAAEKWKEARPPFGAKQTFDNTNDPVQRYCDPPGVSRIYMYPWEMTFIQTPKTVYILYEFTRVWRSVAMDRDHPSDPDSTWMGDSVGKYEGDTFVIDTVGYNDKTWLDHTGHPHSDALHTIERFRRLDKDTLELSFTVDDPKAYTKSFTGKKLFKLTNSPMQETLCVYSEMQSFQQNVIDKTQTPSGK